MISDPSATPCLTRLETGQHVRVRGALPSIKRKRLLGLAAASFRSAEAGPLRLVEVPALGHTALERYRSAGVPAALEACRPWLEALIGPRWLVLAGKVLLRRTWPLEPSAVRGLANNRSNLVWHQDSNPRHGARPMAVLWVSLQEGAGAAVPGLSVLEAPVADFEGMYGYQGERVERFEREMAERLGQFRQVTPVLAAGEALLFDGLTFHRTASNGAMEGPRDALLVRVVPPEDGPHFPEGPHLLVGAFGELAVVPAQPGSPSLGSPA